MLAAFLTELFEQSERMELAVAVWGLLTATLHCGPTRQRYGFYMRLIQNSPCTIRDSAAPVAVDPSAPVNGLVSLWDMLEKYGALFATATIQLSETKWLWAGLDQDVRIGDPQTRFVPLSRPGVEAATRVALNLIRETCSLVGLNRVTPELDRLEQLIWPPYPWMPSTGGALIATAITHLLSHLQDELKAQHFFHVAEQDVRFYGQKALFGEAVGKRFKEVQQVTLNRPGTVLR